MEKAIIYARQSKGNNDVSLSVSNQIQRCLEFAESRKIKIIAEPFKDLNTPGETYPAGAVFEAKAEHDDDFQQWFENASTNKKFRAGLGEALKYVKDVDYIILDDITRLYRPYKSSNLGRMLLSKLALSHCKILCVHGSAVDTASRKDVALANFLNEILDEDRDTKAQNSRNSLNSRKKAGKPTTGCKAFGAIYNTADESIKFDERKAEAIKYIFNKVAEYVPYNQILFELNKNYADCVDKRWYASNIYNITRNYIYTGNFNIATKEEQAKGITILKEYDKVQPIIPLFLFDKVQKVMQDKRENGGKAKYNYKGKERRNFLPLSGFMRCSHCGSKLVVLIDNKKIYYQCQGAIMAKDEECRKSRVLADYSSYRLQGVQQFLLPFLVIALVDQQKQLIVDRNIADEIETEKSKKLQLENAMQVAFQMLTNNKVTPEMFEKMTATTQKQINELDMAIRVLESRNNTDYLIENKMLDYKISRVLHGDIDNNLYTELLHKSINKITVHADTIEFDTKTGVFNVDRIVYKRIKGLPPAAIKIDRDIHADEVYSNASYTISVHYPSFFDSNDKTETTIAEFDKLKIVKIGR